MDVSKPLQRKLVRTVQAGVLTLPVPWILWGHDADVITMIEVWAISIMCALATSSIALPSLDADRGN